MVPVKLLPATRIGTITKLKPDGRRNYIIHSRCLLTSPEEVLDQLHKALPTREVMVNMLTAMSAPMRVPELLDLRVDLQAPAPVQLDLPASGLCLLLPLEDRLYTPAPGEWVPIEVHLVSWP